MGPTVPAYTVVTPLTRAYFYLPPSPCFICCIEYMVLCLVCPVFLYMAFYLTGQCKQMNVPAIPVVVTK